MRYIEYAIALSMAPQPSLILFAGTTVYFTNTMPPVVCITRHSPRNPSKLNPNLNGRHLGRVNVDSGYLRDVLVPAQDMAQPHC